MVLFTSDTIGTTPYKTELLKKEELDITPILKFSPCPAWLLKPLRSGWLADVSPLQSLCPRSSVFSQTPLLISQTRSRCYAPRAPCISSFSGSHHLYNLPVCMVTLACLTALDCHCLGKERKWFGSPVNHHLLAPCLAHSR